MDLLIGGLLFLLGALITSGAYHLSLVTRLGKLEAKVEVHSEQIAYIEQAIADERKAVSDRIYQVADMMKSVLATANEILRQNQVLITTAEVLIKELRMERSRA